MTKNIIGILKSRLGLSEVHCKFCGMRTLKPRGYYALECLTCKAEYNCPNGNLGIDGKGHKYEVKE